MPLGPNPYQGLAAFTEHSADRFFGRKSLTEQLWEKLRSLCEAPPGRPGPVRLLPIIGPSGCGKSSVARGGLIPELARRPLPGWSEAQIAVFTPGAHPIEALAAVLAKRVTADPAPALKAREFANEIRHSTSEGGSDGLRRIAGLLPDIERRPLIVLVDQFEEAYALCSELGERQRFIANLLDAAGDPSARVSVIFTLRSDFLGATNRYPELSQLIAQHAVLVPVMSQDELRQAIAEPAAGAGQPLDPSTINLLIEQAADREGALPLLQFALTQIWDGIGKGVAPAQTLDELGGVGGALAQEAQRLYERLAGAEKSIARRAFVAMVQLGEGAQDTRRRVLVSDIVAHGEASEHVLEVLRAFSQPTRRLVTLSAEPGRPAAAELTHEALLAQWDQFRDWLAESREAIRFHRRLAEAAAVWDQQDRPGGSLWRTPDLDALHQFHDRFGTDMTATEIDFFEAS